MVNNSFYCAKCIHHIRLLYFPQVATFDLSLLINSEQISFGHGDCKTLLISSWKVVDLRLRTLNITKLRTCGCGLQELRSCGLAVADFKNYEVADLRLRIQESWNVVADLRLRIKLLNVQLRTCGCGLRKLKFGCGFADCGLKKKLAVPSTDNHDIESTTQVK